MKVATCAWAAIVVAPIFNGAVFPTETEGWADRQRETAGDTKADRDKERQSCRDSWIGGAERQRQVNRRDRGRGTESRLDRLVVG